MKRLVIITLALALLLPIASNAQKLELTKNEKFFDWNQAQHGVRGVVMYTGLLYMTKNNNHAVLGTVIFSVLWEVKDCYIDWRDTWWGGNKFSPYDILWEFIGIASAQVILDVFKSPIYIEACNNGVSLTYRF